jgi:hypothetical protein
LSQYLKYGEKMDWDLISKTYPDDREGIALAREIHEEVNRAIKDADLSGIDIVKISTANFSEIIPALSRVVRSAWISYYKTEPPFDINEAASSFIGSSSINVPENVSNVVAVFFNNALRAVLKKLREASPEPESMLSGSCSFCGTYARIIFDEETQRTLFCPLCSHSWRYPRVRCTVCGNTDHETLGYIEAEGINGVRVYFCRQCNHFIKAVDIKDRITADAETMDAITLELDELAGEEGFNPVP